MSTDSATTLGELTSGPRPLALPVRIVSDWHLGHPGSKIASIGRISHQLDGIGTLVMAGDGREELMSAWREKGDRLWGDLTAACAEKGVELISLTGNHDPGVSGEGWLKLDDGRIIVTHGDVVYETASPWSRYLAENRGRVEDYLASHPAGSLQDRWENAVAVGGLLRPGKKRSTHMFANLKHAFWPPGRMVEVVKAWNGFIPESGRFLDRFSPGAEVLICGHFHRGGQFNCGERQIYNTGSMMKCCRGYAVDFDGKELSMKRLSLSKR